MTYIEIHLHLTKVKFNVMYFLFCREGAVTSSKRGTDSPMFALRSKDNRYEITTYSIEYLNKILQIAGSNRKLGETRACLEGKSLEACQSPGKGINYSNVLNFYRINVDVPYTGYPLHRENGVKYILIFAMKISTFFFNLHKSA